MKPVINGKRIRLRDFELKDLATYAKWREPGHAWQDFDGPYYRIDPEKAQERVALRKETIVSGAFPNPRTYMVIADSATDELVGEVNCYWKSVETFWMCLGIDIFDSSKWGKGIGREALTLWTQHLFDSHPQIVRLGLETWSGNHGMIKLALRLGYQEEARIRKARVVKGEYFDSLSFGILREEWEKQWK